MTEPAPPAPGLRRRYGQIAAALAVLFLGGAGVGWFAGNAACHGAASPPAEKSQWSQEMLGKLRRDLALTDAQTAAVAPELDRAAEKIEKERDRALFLMHMELLRLHDDLSTKVDDSQKKKLAESGRRLRESLKRQFPQYFREPPPPADPGPASTAP